MGSKKISEAKRLAKKADINDNIIDLPEDPYLRDLMNYDEPDKPVLIMNINNPEWKMRCFCGFCVLIWNDEDNKYDVYLPSF